MTLYVAKPEDEPVVTLPPGWPDDGWPGPGELDPIDSPIPPGYTPQYSIVLGGDTEVSVGDTAAITTSFRDQLTYATAQPGTVNFTAKIGSTPIRLRWSGGSSYGYSASDTAAFSTYWNTSDSLDFEIDEDNLGDTITVTVSSTIGGVRVSETQEIEVIVPHVWSLQLSAATITSWDNDGSTITIQAKLLDNGAVIDELPGSISAVTWKVWKKGVFPADPELRSEGSAAASLAAGSVIFNASLSVDITPLDRSSGVSVYVYVTISGVEYSVSGTASLPAKAYTATLTASHNAPPDSYPTWYARINNTPFTDGGNVSYNRFTMVWTVTTNGAWNASGAGASASISATDSMPLGQYYNATIGSTSFGGASAITGTFNLYDVDCLIQTATLSITKIGSDSVYFSS